MAPLWHPLLLWNQAHGLQLPVAWCSSPYLATPESQETLPSRGSGAWPFRVVRDYFYSQLGLLADPCEPSGFPLRILLAQLAKAMLWRLRPFHLHVYCVVQIVLSLAALVTREPAEHQLPERGSC